MFLKWQTYSLLAMSGLIFTSCIDPFEPETISFESALVVEATITDELKTQEVFLSRTFEFEADGPQRERNASVVVTDDFGNSFVFEEASEGVYNSAIPFRAETGRSYTLQIETSDGRSYSSSAAELPAVTELDSIYAERIINSDGVEGIAIFADSFDPSGNSQNYRYTYDETFRIIAPRWFAEDFVVQQNSCDFLFQPRDPATQTCYRTENSANIIQISTNDFNEDRVSRFMVRFINRDNYIISHRYTILVRQLVQSDASFTFYETLSDFSGSESLFSQTQVGFLNSNVSSDLNSEEKVLGYFEVATVDEQRIFFDYVDFFPGEPLPPYVNSCNESAPPLSNPSGCVLRGIVEANTVRYAGSNPPSPGEGPYLTVPRVCGDCTAIGTTEVPEFWTE